MKKIGVDQEILAVWLVVAVVLLIAGFTMTEGKFVFLSLGIFLSALLFFVLLCPVRDCEGELYRWLAHKGDAKTQCDLAFYFYYGYQQEGLHVELDYNKAVEWFRKAAEQGNVEAQGYLADCYASGKGVGVNYKEAAKWYYKAAEQGDKFAQNVLGIYYFKGLGVAKASADAVRWYRKAAEGGYAQAQYNLGNCYRDGEGITQDYMEAAQWFQKAAEKGLADAQCNLGICYYNGQGVTQDYGEAVKWYRKAAEQGYAAAQHNLSFCYYDGCGVNQDYLEAYKWHSLVGLVNRAHFQKGLEKSEQWRAELKGKLTGEQITEANHWVRAFRPRI